MKNLIFSVFSLTVASVYAQKEGQDFCKGSTGGSYFPLDIKKKKLLWSDTYYFETFEKDTLVNGTTYFKFKQVWKNGDADILLLTNKGSSIVQYNPENKKEIVRWDDSFKPGHTWKNELQGATFTVIGYNEKLETPFCSYEGLLAIKGEYPKVSYVFYYLRGYGYVAATKDGAIISAASPEWK